MLFNCPIPFSPASARTGRRGTFVNGGPDGPLVMIAQQQTERLGEILVDWCASFVKLAESRKPLPPGGVRYPAGYVTPLQPGEYVVRHTQRPDPRLVAALENLQIPKPRPAKQNWAPSRWFVEPRPFGDGFDVCTFVALGRLYPTTADPLRLVKIALDSTWGETPFRCLADAQARASVCNKWPRWLPTTWRLVSEWQLGPGREVPGWNDRTLGDRPQPKPLSELWEAVKETAHACRLYVRWAWRRFVRYFTK